MTNVIKAPIRRIRCAGPNGEHHIAFEEVEDVLKHNMNVVDGEYKLFSLRKLMPELECW